MDYEWKPALRGVGTILAREVGTSTGRGFATSERGHLCDADPCRSGRRRRCRRERDISALKSNRKQP